MKNSLKKIICLLMAAAMLFALCACGQKTAAAPAAAAEPVAPTAEPVAQPEPEEPAEPERIPDNPVPTESEDGIKYAHFADMEYARPDIDQISANVDAAVAALDSEADYETIKAAVQVCDEDYGHYNTMYVLAEIRSYLDTTDTYYADEYAYLEKSAVSIDKIYDHMYYRAAANSNADKLEEDFFWEGFTEEYADENDSIFTPEFVKLTEQESDLLAEYRDLLSAPTVIYNGVEWVYEELLPKVMGTYDYLEVMRQYNKTYAPKLADVFIRLAKVRAQIAKERGYDSYKDYQFYEFFERDYSPEESDVYIQAVREHILPLYEELNSKYSFSASALAEDSLVKLLDGYTYSMGGEIRDSFNFMREYDLSDIVRDSKKSDMSFETYISDYASPFVFVNAGRNYNDLFTYSHEFGHFTRDFIQDGEGSGIDVQEVFSQGMEYLMLLYLDDTVSDKVWKSLVTGKMLDIYSSYIQCGYAEFENALYADVDSLTVDKINAAFLKMTKDYGICEPGYEEFYQYFWMDVPHFFEYPFYVISYPVSNEGSLQVFEIACKESREAGLEVYNKLLADDSGYFLQMLDDCGLTSPFSEAQVEESAEFIRWVFENLVEKGRA